jgi:hypothetical protein
MVYIPFEITVDDKMFAAAMPQDGKIYVRVGKLDICINQTDDELGVVIDCFSAETAEDIHTAQIWYEDIPQK